MNVCEVLLVIFITLKLAGIVTWSWWLVTAPIWAPILIWLTIGLVTSVIIYIYGVKWNKRG